MARISINLLPPEVISEHRKKAKFYKIQFVGIIIVLTMTFFASLTVALRILQSRHIAEVQANVAKREQRVSDLKSNQASLFLLKNRLTVISQYLGVPSKQSLMYQLIDKLIPSSVVVSGINVDKNGEVIFTALAPDAISLEILLQNLTIKENNEGKLSQVSIESLNRGRDGFYRVSFKLKPA